MMAREYLGLCVDKLLVALPTSAEGNNSVVDVMNLQESAGVEHLETGGGGVVVTTLVTTFLFHISE